METTIVVALIAAGGTALGSLATWLSGLSLIRHRLDGVENRLDRVDSKLEEHNGYAKMYSESHEDIAVIKTDIKWMMEEMKEGRKK